MGGAAAAKLRENGHTVTGVDLKEGDVIANLSKDVSRQRAAREVLELADGNLDGAVIAAGVGPIPGKENVELILQVNYYGAVKMLEELRPALAKNGNAKAVLVGSNSTTTMPLVPGFAVNALLKGKTDAAVKAVGVFGDRATAMAYAHPRLPPPAGHATMP